MSKMTRCELALEAADASVRLFDFGVINVFSRS